MKREHQVSPSLAFIYREVAAADQQLADKLIKALLHKIPGDKILTWTSSDPRLGMGSTAVSATKVFEFDNKDYIRRWLAHAIEEKNSCGLMVREFLDVKKLRLCPDGKARLLPEKNLYGFRLGEHQAIPLSRVDLQWACEHDHETGEFIGHEEGTHYQQLLFAEPNGVASSKQSKDTEVKPTIH